MSLRRLLIAVLLVLLAAPAAAGATFAGRNGIVAVSLNACGEGGYLRAYTPAGRALHDLTPRCETAGEDVPRTTSGPEWTPDGSRLAFADDGFGGDPAPRFGSVAADGSDRRPFAPALGTAQRDAAERLSFSPDGTRVVFAADRKVFTSALDGSDRRVLLGGCTDANGCAYAEPRWSPDGRRIAARKLGARPGVLIVDARTGRLVRRLTRGGVELDWSPDARSIVFRTGFQRRELRGGASGGNVYVQRVTGGPPRRIVHREDIADTSPVWSPDGRTILFVSLRFTAGDVGFRVLPSLWRVRARGGRPVKLTTLPETFQEEGFFDPPRLAWQALPAATARAQEGEPVPPVQEPRLKPAARAAGCRLRRHPEEGRDHTTRRVRYRTNPPTSGDHAPVASEDGVYAPGNPPDVEESVHALEHGRVLIQYRRGTGARRIAQLESLVGEEVRGTSGYHVLLFRNQTRMRHEVAATAWGRSLTCRRFDDGVFDALRAFWRVRVDQGPEFIP